MSIKIKSIQDPGNLEKERIVFSVHGDTDIGIYLVLITSVAEDGGSAVSGPHLSFWFPDQNVKDGDLIILYTTKKGENKSVKNTDGSSSHFFYWFLDRPQISSKHGIVLMTGPKWQFEAPKTDADS